MHTVHTYGPPVIKVYIHTYIHKIAGKSRSAAFITAYLMSSFNWHFDAAYSAVKKARLAHHCGSIAYTIGFI